MPHNNNIAEASAISPVTPRRIALKQMAAIFGLSLSAQSLDVLAAVEQKTQSKNPKLLTPEQLHMTGVLAELVIPATDTPGALAVNTHGFIDQYLAECASPSDQKMFAAGLKKINSISATTFQKKFLACDIKEQQQLLTSLEKKEAGFNVTDKQFFIFFKSLTLLGYYTSEAGATQELAYLAIPGGFKGNFPFAKIGKAWSLN